jgi:hypothetical protein
MPYIKPYAQNSKQYDSSGYWSVHRYMVPNNTVIRFFGYIKVPSLKYPIKLNKYLLCDDSLPLASFSMRLPEHEIFTHSKVAWSGKFKILNEEELELLQAPKKIDGAFVWGDEYNEFKHRQKENDYLEFISVSSLLQERRLKNIYNLDVTDTYYNGIIRTGEL